VSAVTPKILDVVKFRIPLSGESKSATATILDLSGEIPPVSALVEILDESVQGPRVLSVPIENLEVIWPSQESTSQEARSTPQDSFEKGLLLLQNGLPIEAIAHFAQAFDAEPRLAGTLTNLTNDLAAKGSYDTAIFLYQLILQLQPEYRPGLENLARGYLNRGVARGRKNLFAEAIADFQSALLLDASKEVNQLAHHNIVAGYTSLAIRHAEISQYKEALALFMTAFQLEPSETTRKNLALSRVGNLALQYSGAAFRDVLTPQFFAEASLMGLTRSECLNAFGATLASIGKVEEGKQVLERAVSEDPTNGLAKSNLERLCAGSEIAAEPIYSWGVQPMEVGVGVRI
jgi:tetratricopeptide (TPR) repeat protein